MIASLFRSTLYYNAPRVAHSKHSNINLRSKKKKNLTKYNAYKRDWPYNRYATATSSQRASTTHICATRTRAPRERRPPSRCRSTRLPPVTQPITVSTYNLFKQPTEISSAYMS